MSSANFPNPAKIPATMPLAPPPPGIKSNFANPDLSHEHQITAALVATLTIALSLVLIRLTTRAYIVRTFGWDDYMCILATALTIVFNVGVAQVIKYDLGLRDYDVSLKYFLQFKLDGWVKWNAITSTVYMITFASIKLSICLLYLRLFGITNKRMRIAVWVIMAVVFIIMISGVTANLAACHPVKKLFVFNSPGVCKFSSSRAVALSSFQVATDILIVAVPIPMVFKLKLPTAQKIGVLIMMSTGLFVTSISIIRLTMTVPKAGAKTSGGLTVEKQFPATFWSVLEINLALAISCMPAIKQFLGLTIPACRSLGSRLTSRGSKSTGTHTTDSYSKTSKSGTTSHSHHGRNTSDPTDVELGGRAELGGRPKHTPLVERAGMGRGDGQDYHSREHILEK